MTQSQASIVLDLLRARGPEGVHTFELRGGAAGRMVANPSERIRELEADGHVITHIPKVRFRGTALGSRYVLAHDACAVPIVVGDDGQLQIGKAA